MALFFLYSIGFKYHLLPLFEADTNITQRIRVSDKSLHGRTCLVLALLSNHVVICIRENLLKILFRWADQPIWHASLIQHKTHHDPLSLLREWMPSNDSHLISTTAFHGKCVYKSQENFSNVVVFFFNTTRLFNYLCLTPWYLQSLSTRILAMLCQTANPDFEGGILVFFLWISERSVRRRNFISFYKIK